jgi:hypothetical protein
MIISKLSINNKMNSNRPPNDNFNKSDIDDTEVVEPESNNFAKIAARSA